METLEEIAKRNARMGTNVDTAGLQAARNAQAANAMRNAPVGPGPAVPANVLQNTASASAMRNGPPMQGVPGGMPVNQANAMRTAPPIEGPPVRVAPAAAPVTPPAAPPALAPRNIPVSPMSQGVSLAPPVAPPVAPAPQVAPAAAAAPKPPGGMPSWTANPSGAGSPPPIRTAPPVPVAPPPPAVSSTGLPTYPVNQPRVTLPTNVPTGPAPAVITGRGIPRVTPPAAPAAAPVTAAPATAATPAANAATSVASKTNGILNTNVGQVTRNAVGGVGKYAGAAVDSLKTGAGRVAVPLTLAATAAKVAGTDTETYANRMGAQAGDSMMGDMGIRAVGALADLGDVVTMGQATKLGNWIAGNGYNDGTPQQPAGLPVPKPAPKPVAQTVAQTAQTVAQTTPGQPNVRAEPGRPNVSADPGLMSPGYDGGSRDGANAEMIRMMQSELQRNDLSEKDRAAIGREIMRLQQQSGFPSGAPGGLPRTQPAIAGAAPAGPNPAMQGATFAALGGVQNNGERAFPMASPGMTQEQYAALVEQANVGKPAMIPDGMRVQMNDGSVQGGQDAARIITSAELNDQANPPAQTPVEVIRPNPGTVGKDGRVTPGMGFNTTMATPELGYSNEMDSATYRAQMAQPGGLSPYVQAVAQGGIDAQNPYDAKARGEIEKQEVANGPQYANVAQDAEAAAARLAFEQEQAALPTYQPGTKITNQLEGTTSITPGAWVDRKNKTIQSVEPETADPTLPPGMVKKLGKDPKTGRPVYEDKNGNRFLGDK